MADDDGLDAIRQRRLAELQGQQGDFSQGNSQAAQQQAERAKQQQEFKDTLLTQCLDQGARARLANIKVAKPEKAAMVESMIVRMAQGGQLAGKMNEETLKGLLETISERTQKKTTVKFDRRRANIDSDDEDF
ncbi:programmed cell death protein 5-like [Littorina saxatilis]|uniref:Programmed cell death protein 5 n=1 Tax=Littorina saxatilis TaxID=31220 RepID=A0AAN9C6A2_9CAEN